MTMIKNNKIGRFKNLWIFKYKSFCNFGSYRFYAGWMTLILANPITSSLSKYYEQVKANYSRDIDHLIF